MSRKVIYFDRYCGCTLAAVTEDGKLGGFKIERSGKTVSTGSIYMGRVKNVLSGMQAAFVDCGLERNCYLSASDAPFTADGAPTPDCDKNTLTVREGDLIPVQIVKLPVGDKGARVTAQLSFVGKTLIYMPRTPFTGVSRKIADAELRKNLLFYAARMKTEGEGIVLRAAAPYERRSRIEIELEYMRNLYQKILDSAQTAAAGDLLYADANLPMRILRDTLVYDIDKIIVGERELYGQIASLIDLYPPSGRKPQTVFEEGDMFEKYGLSGQLQALGMRRVPLENGAYLVFDKTEALTSIDVNTGKFTGDDNLEQTVYYTNILAAREIARQVKLRNIGGIVVVDFIDMTSAAHNRAITEELERALADDSCKCTVAPMSQFGLVEFTRRRTGAALTSVIERPCPHCAGKGSLPVPEFSIFGARHTLLSLYGGGARKIVIEAGRRVYRRICEWQSFRDDMESRCKDAEIWLCERRNFSDSRIECSSGGHIPENAVRLF